MGCGRALLEAAQRFDEAREAVRALRGGRHPMHLLLADQAAFPFPATTRYSKFHSDSLRSLQLSKGRYSGLPYPLLRVHVYTFARPISEVEISLRQRWPGLVLFETERDEGADGRLKRDGSQLFLIRGDDLVPAQSKEELAPLLREGALPSGIALSVRETTKPSPRELERFEMEPVETFSVIFLMNNRRAG